MPKLVLATRSSADRGNLAPTSERLINIVPIPGPESGKAAWILRAAPGTRSFSTLGGPFLRAMARVEGKLYAVAAGALWRIEENGAATYLVAIADDESTSMVGHRSAVVIAANGTYNHYSTSLTQPGSGRLSSVGSVAFLDQYTILSQRDGREIEWTEVGDPTDRNALYFRTAEARDDKIIRIIAVGSALMVLKQHSVETWYNTGLSGASAFRRVDGGVQDKGLKAFNLVCKTPDGVFYVNEDNVAMHSARGPVSPPNVVNALEAGTPTHCLYFEDRGAQMHAIRFSDRPAWVWDAATGRWHERSSGPAHKPWDVICAEKAYGHWHLGDRNGRIYRLGTTPVDATGAMRRTIVSAPLYMEGQLFSIPELELLGEFGRYSVAETAPNWLTNPYGEPLEDADGYYITSEVQEDVTTLKRPGRLWLRVSKDGGHTFGLPKLRDIGKVGQYGARCRFTAMGQFRNFVAEVNLTDPYDVPLLSEANVAVA
jgi:hypothetical protein